MRPALVVFLVLFGLCPKSQGGVRDFCSSLLKSIFPAVKGAKVHFVSLPRESVGVRLLQLEEDLNLALSVRDQVDHLGLKLVKKSGIPHRGEKEMKSDSAQISDLLREGKPLPYGVSLKEILWPLSVQASLQGLNEDFSLELGLYFSPVIRGSRKLPLDSWVIFESSFDANWLLKPHRKVSFSSVEAQLPLWSFEFSDDGEVQFSLRRERSSNMSDLWEFGKSGGWTNLSTSYWGVIEIHGAKNRIQSIEAGLFLLEKTALFIRERAEGGDPDFLEALRPSQNRS